jgi:hypothetical protein
MNPSETYFQVLHILSHASQFISRAMCTDATQFHVDIGCHINPIDHTTTFDT